VFDARATTARCLDRNDSSGGIAVFFASVALVEAGGFVLSPPRCRRRKQRGCEPERSCERKAEVRAPAIARDRFAGARSARSRNAMAAEARR
jgi:hypothetical protein